MSDTEKGKGNELTNLPGDKGAVVRDKPKGVMGAPSTYTSEIADNICGQIAEGKSLRKILREDDSMPAMSTVFKWLGEHTYFSEQYTRAKMESADAHTEEIIDIADEVKSGRLDPQAARVAIDAYKWTASKLKPKKYGDKLDLASTSEVTHKFTSMKDEELDQALKSAGINITNDINQSA